MTVKFTTNGLSFSINEDELSSQSVLFESINIYDFTDTLQIRITGINGEDAEKAAAQGGIQYGTDYQRWKAIERVKQNQAAQIARQNVRRSAINKFSENHSIRFGGWGGPNFLSVKADAREGNEGPASGPGAIAGGAAIELCWLRANPGALQFSGYTSLQTGVTVFQDTDKPLSEPIVTRTVTQIPLLGRAGFNMQGSKGTAGLDVSIHGGLGVNLASANQTLLSSSPISFIVGGEFAWTGRYQSLFASYQFNGDFTDTRYEFGGENYSYLGSRSVLGVGLKWLIPLRKY
jgi:hypothetical protein